MRVERGESPQGRGSTPVRRRPHAPALCCRRESTITLDGLLERDGDAMVLPVTVNASNGPVFYVLTVDEVPLRPPTTPDAKGIIVGDRANRTSTSLPWLYGRWVNGWWSPWEHHEIRDDRVVYFARVLWKGRYTARYVARATTAGTFVRPPAHAEEMYNPSLGGRSEGGTFRVIPRQ